MSVGATLLAVCAAYLVIVVAIGSVAYRRTGAVAMLEIAVKVIRHALGRPQMVSTTMPTAGRVTVRRQADENRDVVHLLYATPALRGNLRGRNVEPIQDLSPLFDVEVAVHAPQSVANVTIVPEGDGLAFEQAKDTVRFTVPKVRGHQMVEIKY